MSRAAVPARELSSINFRSMLGGPLMAVVDAQAQSAMRSVEFIRAVGFETSAPDQLGRTHTTKPIYVSFKYPKELSPYEPAVPALVTGVNITAEGDGYTTPPTLKVNGVAVGATVHVESGKVKGVTFDAPVEATGSNSIEFSAPSSGATATGTAIVSAAQDAKPAVFQDMELEVPILTMLPIPFIRVEETTIDFNAKINSIEEAQTNSMFRADASAGYNYSASLGGGGAIKGFNLSAKVSSSVEIKVSSSYQRNTTSGYKVDRTYSMAVHIRAVQDEMPAGMERLLGILEDNISSRPSDAATE